MAMDGNGGFGPDGFGAGSRGSGGFDDDLGRRRRSLRPSTPPSPKARWVLRVLGGVLIAVGLYFAITGGIGVFHPTASAVSVTSGTGLGRDGLGRGGSPAYGSELDLSTDAQPTGADFARLVGGAFALVFGLGALNAGFIGAQARYAAHETGPAVRETGMAWRGEGGGSGSGRTGKFCSECGARADVGARFCDSCGHTLA